MDHKQWREYEEKCTQERPAACVTACPVHVDARSFMVEMKAGNFNKALAIYRKAVPFPGIIGRICDHPCEAACKRGEVGDPIAIAALEKACVEMNTAPPAKIAAPPQKKDTRVAVVGGGLSGMAAAFELAGKGYRVVIFEATDRLGGSLWDLPDTVLPRQVIVEETGLLAALGVETRFNTTVGQTLSLQDLRSEFDAVYFGLGIQSAIGLGLEVDQAGRPLVDPVSFATSQKGVFAGGGLRTSPRHSPIFSLSDGKRVAISIDRFIQGVSLTAVRDNEGSYETNLFTSTQGIAALPAVVPANPLQGYTREEAIAEAGRCIECQCLECVKVCEYLDHFKAYPKVYARQINQNLRIVKGIRGANDLINSCAMCGLCKEVCPEDFDMRVIIREARTEMVKTGIMPPSAHEFPLRDMEFANGERAAFTRNQPGFNKSDYVFFPGCQLGASAPGHVEKAYSYLTEKLSGGVGLMLRCCGAPAEWAGRTEQFQEGLQEIKKEWGNMGKPRMVLACSTCFQTFKDYLPELEIVSLWEMYDQYGLPKAASLQKPGVVAVHDACTTRYETQIHDSVRNILQKLEFKLEELPNSREKTECCGYGGLTQFANRKLADDMAKRRIDESPADYVAYCAMCRDNFANKGKKTHHILDVIYGQADLVAPAKRCPSYSRRRDNRTWLKNKLLTEVWGEKATEENSPHQAIKLMISPEVEKVLDDRFILEEDLQKVIDHAEKTGSKIINRKSGHISAFHKLVNVTYWVEFTKQEDVYVIHNAYSHRMDVEGNS